MGADVAINRAVKIDAAIAYYCAEKVGVFGNNREFPALYLLVL